MQKKNTAIDGILFDQLAKLHNSICTGEQQKESAFDDLVLQNRSKIAHPIYLEIFTERVSFEPNYYLAHTNMCKVFFDLATRLDEFESADLSLRTALRTALFKDSFEEFLEEIN